jgi:hypothetical protein
MIHGGDAKLMELCWETRSMRMPVLSYFLVAGTVLFGVLTLVGNKLEPKPLPVTQTVGVPQPFKAPPEDVQSRTSNLNFEQQIL